MFVKRSGVVGAAFISVVLVACETDVSRLAARLEGEPAALEPGYVEARTSTLPDIEIQSSGGFDGGGTGNIQVWADGTVLFDGAGCPHGSRRRGKISPARVHAVLDLLDTARFSSWDSDVEGRCADAFITSLTVRHGDSVHTVTDAGCRSSSEPAAKAIAFVKAAVGKNACSPSCRDKAAPDFCE